MIRRAKTSAEYAVCMMSGIILSDINTEPYSAARSALSGADRQVPPLTCPRPSAEPVFRPGKQ